MRARHAVVVTLLLAATAHPLPAGNGTSPAQVLSTEQQASSVLFATPDDGWLALTTTSYLGGGARAEVLATDDGGERWVSEWEGRGYAGRMVAAGASHAVVAVYPSGTCVPGEQSSKRCTAELFDLDELGKGGANRAGMFDGQLLSTAWSSSTTGVAAVVPRSCPAELPPPPEPVAPCPGELFRTVDGGEQWAEVERTSYPLVAVAEDGRRWWAVEARLGFFRFPSERPQLVVWGSTDGGAAWARRGDVEDQAGLAYLTERIVADLVAGAGGGLWLSLVDFDSCAMHGCGVAGIWSSDDGGARWSPAPAVRTGTGCGSGEVPIAPSPAGGIYQAVESPLAACGPPAGILEKWDGHGWRPVHTWDLDAVDVISWPGPSTGFVLVGDALARTTDGGRSWSQVWPAVAPTGPLVALSSTSAVAAGDAGDPGAILRTTDGGARWAVLADLGGDITALSAPVPADLFAVVLDPVRNVWSLEVSSDGGRRWSARGVLPHGRTKVGAIGVSGLWMASPSDGLLVTTSGADWASPQAVAPSFLFSTVDGGLTWREVATVRAGQFFALSGAAFARLPSGQWWGLVSAGGPHPEGTLDNGATWETLTSAPAFNGAQILSPDEVVTWGDEGDRWEMCLTRDGGRSWSCRALLTGRVATSVAGMQLSFVNLDDGWWSVDGHVWLTHDGGAGWVPAKGPAT